MLVAAPGAWDTPRIGACRGLMDFRILGSLDVRANGDSLPLGGPKQRALLAVLLLSANRVVSRDRLVEGSWPGQPADAVEHALTVRVSRLRKALDVEGSGLRLVTRPPGYLLRVDPDELDLQRFEQLVADGREAREAGDPARAAASLREAESLWRGRPLADLEFEPFARLDAERLQELCVAAVEERIDAELALGRHGALVAELEALVAEHPLRERLRAQLMRALYANSRQAEALSVYTDTRQLLVEDLGIEPSEELRELERKILNQDPSLLRSAGPEPHRDTALIYPSRKERRRRWWARRRGLLLVAAGVFVAALVGTILLSSGGHPAAGLRLDSAGSVVFLDARSGKPVGQLATGPDAGIMRLGWGSLWKLKSQAMCFRSTRARCG